MHRHRARLLLARPIGSADVHHDEDLPPWQRTIISAVAPSLLLNIPKPWRAFVCIVIFHLLMLVCVTSYVFLSCPLAKTGAFEFITFRGWDGITHNSNSQFGCLKYEFDFEGRGVVVS